MTNREKVLVTGGAGYLGSVLTRELLNKGVYVVLVDRFLYGSMSIQGIMGNPRLEIIDENIVNLEADDSRLDGIGSVVHLAGVVGDEAYKLNPIFSREQGLLSTIKLAQICIERGINRFIFASSCSVYGQGENILDEESTLSPVSLYAKDKIETEQILLSLINKSDFSPIILRMGTLFGSSYRPRFDLVVNLLTKQAIKEKEFTIYGGSQWRPFLHVKDAARVYADLLHLPIEDLKGEIINVGHNDLNCKLSYLGEKIIKRISNAKYILNEDIMDKRNYIVSFNKLQSFIKFVPKHDLDSGIKELYDWIERNPDVDLDNSVFYNHKSLNNYGKTETYISRT